MVEIRHLVKEYGKSIVLNDINLNLQEGRIYGFIGENGAGKTTLMRILTGLSKQTSGEYYLFGKKNEDMGKQRNITGSIIENPALIAELTAYQNLKYKMIMNNVNDDCQIDKILREVNLDNVGNKKIRDFSLGMKQRLGIAMTLVNTPQLLILDEPINGLDPMGIIEMRNILKNLNSKYGITIFISSHILSEMYQLATDYIFIHEGRIIKQLTSEELEAQFARWIVIETDDVNKSRIVLENYTAKNNIKIVNESTINLYNCDKSVEVTKCLVQNGIGVKQIHLMTESFEEYYSKLINQDLV